MYSQPSENGGELRLQVANVGCDRHHGHGLLRVSGPEIGPLLLSLNGFLALDELEWVFLVGRELVDGLVVSALWRV